MINLNKKGLFLLFGLALTSRTPFLIAWNPFSADDWNQTVKDAGSALKEAGEWLGNAIVDTATTLGLDKLGKWIGNQLEAAWNIAKEATTVVWTEVLTPIGVASILTDAANLVVDAYKYVKDQLMGAIGVDLKPYSKQLDDIAATLQGLPDKIRGQLGDVDAMPTQLEGGVLDVSASMADIQKTAADVAMQKEDVKSQDLGTKGLTELRELETTLIGQGGSLDSLEQGLKTLVVMGSCNSGAMCDLYNALVQLKTAGAADSARIDAAFKAVQPAVENAVAGLKDFASYLEKYSFDDLTKMAKDRFAADGLAGSLASNPGKLNFAIAQINADIAKLQAETVNVAKKIYNAKALIDTTNKNTEKAKKDAEKAGQAVDPNILTTAQAAIKDEQDKIVALQQLQEKLTQLLVLGECSSGILCEFKQALQKSIADAIAGKNTIDGNIQTLDGRINSPAMGYPSLPARIRGIATILNP